MIVFLESKQEYSAFTYQPLKWQVAALHSQSKCFQIVLYSYNFSQYKEI